MNRLSRSHFVQTVLGAGAAASIPVPAAAQGAHPAHARLSHALVLSGGGARGAYQAGIIGALAARGGVTDGQPLAPYGVICGTSIGALNGWMVATGQYARLQQLWSTISSQKIMQVKPQFAAVRNPNSGLATRVTQAVGLLDGLRTDVRGIFQSEPVMAWLKANVNPATPVLVPFAWTSTNLTAQRTEYFYRVPKTLPDFQKRRLLAAIRATIGPTAVLWEVPDEHLHAALFASAAIPIAFDPVELPAADGTMHQYVDGGVAANTPIGLARTIARAVQVVLLDPPFVTETYNSALAIGFGVYGTMQRRLLENDIRSIFVQSLGKRSVTDLTALTSGLSLTADDSAALQAYFSEAGDTELSYIRPAEKLPVTVGGFNDGDHIKEAMQLGTQAAQAGFTQYTLTDFFSSRA